MGPSCGCTKTNTIPILETFTKIKKIGSGAYGEAFLIMSNTTNKKYVAKIVNIKNPTEEVMEKASSEANILKMCNHPNIILFKEAFKQRNGEEVKLNIITEYCDEGDLEAKAKEQELKRKHFDEIQLINWLMQICLGLKYLHKKKIIHRDIKPSNIFLTKKGYVKLGDFGLSKIFNNEDSNKDKIIRVNSLKGTVYFFSPEMVVYKEYNEKSDIWALGITFYYLMNFSYLYSGTTEREIFISIALDEKEENSKFRKNSYSKEFVDLINSMLSKKPEDRPSAKKILKSKVIKERMEPFLKDHKFNSKEVSKFIEEYEKQMKEKNKSNKNKEENCFLEKNIISDNIEIKNLTEEEIEELKKEKEKKEKYEMNQLLNIVQKSL